MKNKCDATDAGSREPCARGGEAMQNHTTFLEHSGTGEKLPATVKSCFIDEGFSLEVESGTEDLTALEMRR